MVSSSAARTRTSRVARATRGCGVHLVDASPGACRVLPPLGRHLDGRPSRDGRHSADDLAQPSADARTPSHPSLPHGPAHLLHERGLWGRPSECCRRRAGGSVRHHGDVSVKRRTLKAGGSWRARSRGARRSGTCLPRCGTHGSQGTRRGCCSPVAHAEQATALRPRCPHQQHSNPLREATPTQEAGVNECALSKNLVDDVHGLGLLSAHEHAQTRWSLGNRRDGHTSRH